MEIKLLEVGNGECIWLRYGKEKIINLVIDSGPVVKKNGKNQFLEILKEINNKNEKLNLLILTHIDDDHIGGFFSYIKNKNSDSEKDFSTYLSIIEKVWFNTGNNISNFINSPEFNNINYDNNFPIDLTSGTCHSVRKEIDVAEFLACNGINLENIIYSKEQEHTLGEATIRVLSPDKSSLIKFLKHYTKEKAKLHSSDDMRNLDIDKIDISKFEEDNSQTNIASIAFILKYNGKNYAFLGDAYPSNLIGNLKETTEFEFIKLPHHGSSRNNNKELLEKFKTNKYILCKRDFYDKKTIAIISKINDEKKCVYTNYEWYSKNFFTKNDKEYIKEKIVIVKKLRIES